MNIRLAVSMIAVLVTYTASAFAAVVEQRVTQEFLKEHPKAFSVDVTKQDDGLLRFTIKRYVPKPGYYVANLVVRKGSALVAESHFPSFVREDAATYHLTISSDYVSGSEFALSERSFVHSKAQDVPLPGGIDYKVRLKDFVSAEIQKDRQ